MIRSLGALSGGLLRGVGDVVLPAPLRRTVLYRAMVGVTLRFLIRDLGQVEGQYETSDPHHQNFVLQRSASHGIEIMGLIAFHASPVWVLAALADLTGGGQKLLREIVDELKREGLLEDGDSFDTLEHVLVGLERTTAHVALTLNMPPVNLEGLRQDWEKFKATLQSIPPERVPALALLENTWNDMRESARAQDRSVIAVSSLMAVSTLAHVPSNLLWLSKAANLAARRTTETVGGAVLDHYQAVLREISQTGFLACLKRESRPYLRAAVKQFAPQHETLTDRMLRRKRAPVTFHNPLQLTGATSDSDCPPPADESEIPWPRLDGPSAAWPPRKPDPSA